MAKSRRTLDEIIELGQDALGDEVARLATGDGEDGACPYCSRGKQLVEYVRGALAIRKDHREQAMVKQLADIKDADLHKVIASEIRCPPEELQAFIDRWKSKRARAS